MARNVIGMVLALVMLTALAQPASATIYKYIDKNGNLVLTDEPVPGAVIVPEHQVMTMPFPKGDVQPLPVKKDVKVNYTITITSPEANAIYYRNQDDSVAVAVSVDPALKPGSVLQLELDGKPFDGTEIDIDSLDRGSHSIGGEIIDGKGSILGKAANTVFFVQQRVSADVTNKKATGP